MDDDEAAPSGITGGAASFAGHPVLVPHPQKQSRLFFFRIPYPPLPWWGWMGSAELRTYAALAGGMLDSGTHRRKMLLPVHRRPPPHLPASIAPMIFSPAIVPAWVRETLGWPTGRGVRVGVIGSGYDNDVPDARVVQGVSFVDPEDDLEQLRTVDDHDRMGQGTTCARLVLRMAPGAQVVPIRIFGEEAESSPGTLRSGLAWAEEQALDVVCVAAFTGLRETIGPLYAECEKGRRKGMIFVAGQKPEFEETYPAIFEPVIGVERGTFGSMFDFHYRPDAAYEVQAWGEGEFVTRGGGRQYLYGSEYSAAVVAGIVALLRERYPGAPVERIRELLQRFSLPG